VRLLISAGKVDKRKSFYKTLEKLGPVEIFAGWSDNQDQWHEEAAALVRRALRDAEQDISDEALAQLLAFTGPQPRLLAAEVEKLVLFAGARTPIEAGDVTAIVSRNKQARAFALGDALGARDLAAVLRCLDQEFWEIRRDSKRNEIGLLYGLIGKVRALLLAKEMLAQKWLKPETDFNRFKGQLARVPSGALPEDRKYNPLAVNPFVLFRALGQSAHYTQPELIQAMDLLLECNQKLISRNLEPSLLLQQTLIQIVGRPAGTRAAPVRAAA
jgi:DNA polymerase III delta subunit